MPVKKEYQTRYNSRSFGEETNQDESNDFGCVSLDYSDTKDRTRGTQTTSCIHSFFSFCLEHKLSWFILKLICLKRLCT